MRKRRSRLLLMYSMLVWLVAVVVLAGSHVDAQPSPYAGQETRGIKALSDQEVSDYLSGKGMGLAKVAELNGYPGPAHVLALASELNLNTEQRKQTEALYKGMQEKAIAMGRMLVDEEMRLDQLFASKMITAASLEQALKKIGELQAQVRLIHLEAHLAQAGLLSPKQTAEYSRLRGYSESEHHKAHTP